MGAGKVGQLVYDEIMLGGEVCDEVFFYDNDIKKQGTLFNDVPVLTFEEYLEKVKCKDVRIILASDSWKELYIICRDLCVEDRIIGVYSWKSFASNPYVKRIYGQDAEELYLIEKIREKYGEEYKGFYVDIGAHHPYRFSNTHWAYTRGWSGINIEPNSDTVKLFEKARSRDININCGVGSVEKVMNYYKFDEPAFNTFDEEAYSGLRIPKEIVHVLVKPLAKILDECRVNKIDFINIDVEGYEMQVLLSNDWEKFQPTFILVEQKNISISELLESEIYLFLKKMGYECEWKGIRTVIYKLG